jgi:hypothetical protein
MRATTEPPSTTTTEGMLGVSDLGPVITRLHSPY